jgi:hypothetical protein
MQNYDDADGRLYNGGQRERLSKATMIVRTVGNRSKIRTGYPTN